MVSPCVPFLLSLFVNAALYNEKLWLAAMYQLNPLFESALRQNSLNQRLYVLTLLVHFLVFALLLEVI